MVKGAVTLDGEDIGRFEISAGGIVTIDLTKKDMTFGDAVDLAHENGMMLGLIVRPDFEDHVSQHRTD